MELSVLLAEQIVVIFLMMAIGYVIVKIRLFKTEDSSVLSNLVVYICFPCVIINSFQIELTARTTKGLLLAVAAAAAAHAFMLLAVWILEKPLRLNSIEKVSIIYTNAGYLVIPLVSAVLGEEWVFYTTAFLLVQNLLTWTHGVSVLKGESERNYRKILLNPNIIALAAGILLGCRSLRIYGRILRHSGRAVADFVALESPGTALVNMGLTGGIGFVYLLVLRVPLNGPLVCCILAMAGFAAFGKHPKNVVPVMAGAILSSALMGHVPLTAPATLLATLLCTGLAPIAGQFGWKWGAAAGFVHMAISITTALPPGLPVFW